MLSKTLQNDQVQVVFTIKAYEGESEAHLVGDFNDWQIGRNPMHRNSKDQWEASIMLERDQEYRFRYLINEQNWHNDPDADRYVSSDDGLPQSVVNTAVALPNRQITQKHFDAKRRQPDTYRRLLMPFIDSQHFHTAFQPMLELVQRLGVEEHAEAPELILLRVRDCAGHSQDKEEIYSELRGVQARLHNCPLPSRIDTIIGPTASSIVDYAGRNAVDLILLPKHHTFGAGEPTEHNVAHKVAHGARCDTLIVD